MKFALLFFLHLLLLSADSRGQESRALTVDDVPGILQILEAECDVPNQTTDGEWLSYASSTENARLRCIAQLTQVGMPAEALILEAAEGAKPEYSEMLTLSLAAIGNSEAASSTAALMLKSKMPAVRVCAAFILRRLKDKRFIEHLKKALNDPFKRKDGSCVTIGDGMVYPVRLIATGALVGMGVPIEDIRKIGGQIKE